MDQLPIDLNTSILITDMLELIKLIDKHGSKDLKQYIKPEFKRILESQADCSEQLMFKLSSKREKPSYCATLEELKENVGTIFKMVKEDEEVGYKLSIELIEDELSTYFLDKPGRKNGRKKE